MRIGQARSSTEDGQTRVSVECWLDGMPANGARVQLYADIDLGHSAEIIEMKLELN